MSDRPPTTTTITWLSLVLKADPDHYEPYDAYEFSNERKFKSSDKGTSGIYKKALSGMDNEPLFGMDGERLTGMDQ